MWKRVAHVGLVSVISTAAVATRARGDELYHVNLSPPTHVGQQFNCYVRESEELKTDRIGGKAITSIARDYSRLDLYATVKVADCDNRGMPRRLNLTVHSFEPATPTMVFAPVIVPPETHISVRSAQLQSDPPKYIDLFSEADMPCHPATVAALRRVISLGGETESSEQQAFGTDKQLPIGGSWSLDGEPGARLLAKMHIDAAPKDVEGQAQFVGIMKQDNIDCLEIRMTVHGSNVPMKLWIGETANGATANVTLIYFISKDGKRVVDAHSVSEVTLDVPSKIDSSVDRHLRKVIRHIQISDVPKEQAPRN